jgi:succinate dehydrogenase / fumarate reductase membrane anchor subunit
MSATPHIDIMRSPLGRARGLGSARQGSHHWLMHRLTSVALIPLTLWFIYSVIHMSGASHQQVIDWMSSPYVLAMLLSLVVATFHHLAAGLQVVIEDYLHQEPAKTVALLAVKGACWLLALICAVSVLKVGL